MTHLPTWLNPFGEIAAKGSNDGWQEYFDYDNAGHLWRTNADDGVNKAYFYDLQGKLTAELKSADVDLRALASPDAIAALPNSQTTRTENRYDALGRLISQAQQAFTLGEANSNTVKLTPIVQINKSR